VESIGGNGNWELRQKTDKKNECRDELELGIQLQFTITVSANVFVIHDLMLPFYMQYLNPNLNLDHDS
jgi:hypothetical protein